MATTGRPNSPFDLDDGDSYARWRERKLAGAPATAGDLVVEVADPENFSAAEFDAMMTALRRANMAIYAARRPAGDPKDRVRAVDTRFGLARLDANLKADDDGITSIRVTEGDGRGRYIPYTDRPINWHTDGYYNAPEHRVRAMTLHCVQDAAVGGGNGLMDHDIAYILLRDENPDWVAALMRADAMTIPPNDEDGVEIRPARAGPVFSVDGGGALHMRYTARPRNVVWRDDPATAGAVGFLDSLLNGDSPYIFRHRLEPGQGLITNNVLHNRSGFVDDAVTGRSRCVYRARYYDRIAGT